MNDKTNELDSINEKMKLIRKLTEKSEILRSLQNNSAIGALRSLQNNSTIETLRSLQNNSAIEALRSLQVMQKIYKNLEVNIPDAFKYKYKTNALLSRSLQDRMAKIYKNGGRLK